MTEVIVLFVLLAVLIVIGMPIGVSLGVATTVVLATMTKLSLNILPQNAFTALDSFPLMAIPFFIIAGNLMKSGGIAKRLVDFFNELIGWVAGGLGMATTATCMFFAAISGSANATTSAVGSFMIPAMKEKRYDENFAAALCAAAGTIGVIIPPSVPFVVYAVIANVSIGDMFLAGILPGVLIGVVLMVMCFFVAKIHHYGGSGMKFSLRRLVRTFLDSFWAIMTPVIILGGIYGGVFTPTEAAVVGIVYSLIVGFFIYRELTIKDLINCFRDTAHSSGVILFTLGLAMSFAYFLTMQQIPAKIGAALAAVSSPVVTLLIINVILLIVGCFIDNFSAVAILAPIFVPIVKSFGMDPVQFGVIMTVNLAIGFVTPPYGVNLFVASAISDLRVEGIIRKIWLMIVLMILCLLVITFWEPVTMGLVYSSREAAAAALAARA